MRDFIVMKHDIWKSVSFKQVFLALTLTIHTCSQSLRNTAKTHICNQSQIINCNTYQCSNILKLVSDRRHLPYILAPWFLPKFWRFFICFFCACGHKSTPPPHTHLRTNVSTYERGYMLVNWQIGWHLIFLVNEWKNYFWTLYVLVRTNSFFFFFCFLICFFLFKTSKWQLRVLSW